MLRLKAVLHRALSLALVVFIGLVCVGSGTANADGSLTPPPPSDALTRFESFILTNCFPCVRESYYIATVPVYSIKAPTFPGVPTVRTGTSTRAGEVRFELLRAYPVGLKSREHMAMRVRSEEHTSELQSHSDLVCRLLLEKKNISIEWNM